MSIKEIPIDFNLTSGPYHRMDKLWLERTEIKLILALIMTALCCVTIIGNLCAIYRFRKASLVGNLFIISLACADLVVGCFVMPVAGIYALSIKWTFTLPLCQIWLIADYTASTASILNLLTLSLDRYWSITSPLKYLGKRTKSRALIMICLAWCVSLLWIIPITSWHRFFNNNVRIVPKDTCNTEYNKNLWFKLFTATINFYLPLLVMICINGKVYLAICKRYQSPIMKYTSSNANSQNPLSKVNSINSLNFMYQKRSTSQEKSNNSSPQCMESIYENSKQSTYHLEIPNSSKVGKLKKRSSSEVFKSCNRQGEFIEMNNDLEKHRSMFFWGKKPDRCSINLKNRREDIDIFGLISLDGQNHSMQNSPDLKPALVMKFHKKHLNRERQHMNKHEKAFKQLLAIVSGFTICFTPYFILYVIVAVCEDCVLEPMITLSVWLGYINSTINPFLYAFACNYSCNLTKMKSRTKSNTLPQHFHLNNKAYSTVYFRKNIPRYPTIN